MQRNSQKVPVRYLLVILCWFASPLCAVEKAAMAPMPEALENYMLNRLVKTIKQPVYNTSFIDEASAALDAAGEGGDESNPLEPYAEKSMLPKLIVSESVTPETSDLLGERVDLNTGAVSFHQTDISIPGNSALEVAVRRVHRGKYSTHLNTAEFADWRLDIPNINTTVMYAPGFMTGSWGQGHECSGILEPGTFSSGNGTLLSHQYWNGDAINVPGMTNEKLLNPWNNLLEGAEGGIYKRVTKSNWRIYCFDRFNEDGLVIGEGFRAQAPNGHTYTFDQLKLIESKPSGNKVWGGVLKFDLHMQVSKIEDQFGNWVKYNYNSNGRLENISSNDNRLITFAYKPAPYHYNIDKVTVNGRQWSYDYQGLYSNRMLSKVTLPNAQQWRFDLNGIAPKELPSDDILRCRHASADNTEYSGWIKHPNGITGTYTVKETFHGQTNVLSYPGLEGASAIPKCFATFSLKKKTLIGEGVAALSWTYHYSQNRGTFASETVPSAAKLNIYPLPLGVDHTNYKTSTVNAPDGSSTRYYYNRDWTSAFDGTMMAQEYFDTDDRLLKTVTSSFGQGEGVGHPSMRRTNTLSLSYRIEKTATRVTLEHGDGNSNYLTYYSGFNKYGKALNWQQVSDTGTRNIRLNVTEDRPNWRLNLPTTVEVKGASGLYKTAKETTYKTATGTNGGKSYSVKVAHEEKSYGYWITRYSSYHGDGNVQTIQYNAPLIDANGNKVANTFRYQTLNSYKRGQPQSILLPKRYASSGTINASRVIDNNGWVVSTKDLNGTTTGYGYDGAGRLRYIDKPGSWLDTYFDWQQATGQAPVRTTYSCALNGAKTGCSGEATYSSAIKFDALMRPTLTTQTDVVNNFNRYQTKTFNAWNNEVFSSYWSQSQLQSAGKKTTYDGLQRLSTTTHTGGGTQSIEYLRGNQQQVIDAQGNATTTKYLAYGSPAYDQALKITSPEGVSTTQVINVLGNVTAITQQGPNKAGTGTDKHTEYRAYGSREKLCKVVRKDVGTTKYFNNALGEVLWQAQGVTGGEINNCSATVTSTDKITFIRDNLGQLQNTDYGDSSPDITYKTDNNGNVKTLIAGVVTLKYNYNSLNLLEDETLSHSAKSFGLIYDYNPQGHLASVTYPDGAAVQYAPNGFGQPTKSQRKASPDRAAFTYASGASYYPSGSIDTFKYGNGIIHKTTLNDRHVPSTIKDSKTGVTALHYGYTYDDNLNVTSIKDYRNSAYSLTNLTYDGLDRLKTTTGGIGIGNSSMNYDGLGNLTRYTSKGRNLNYNYNTTYNRLTSITGISGKYSSFAYDDRGNIYNNGNKNFIYNRANHLTGSGSNSYLYDGHNRRVKQTSSKGTSYSFYSQSGTLLYRETPKGGINYIYLGKKLIAKDGEKLTGGKQHYRPFGSSIEGEIDDVGYTGHKFDSELGLSYMQARYYDPVIGRFYSNDPKGFSNVHNFNRYAYAANNPYKYIDPDGKDFKSTYISIKIPFLGSVDVGNVSFTPNAQGQGDTTSGLFVRVGTPASNVDSDSSSGLLKQKTPIKGAIVGVTIGKGAGTQTNQNFNDPDVSIDIGLGIVTGTIGSLNSSTESSASSELGIAIGADTTVSKSFTVTGEDIKAAASKAIETVKEQFP